MTEIIDSMKCVHCGKQRNPDNRKPCEHCGLRKRDAGGNFKSPDVQRVEGQDLVVIASDPNELVTAQTNMIARLDEKIADAQRELDAARATIEQSPAALAESESETARMLVTAAQERLAEASKKLAAVAERRLVYLQKVRAALQAGYVMMPNFPGHVIAIRTARKGPPRRYQWDVSPNADVAPIAPDAALPPGEGKYVSPTPEHTHTPGGTSGRQDIDIHGFDEEIALPVEFIKPEIVQRTAKAIDLKIFDEIVLVRDGEARDSFAGQGNPPRGRDPMVVGRIVLRKPGQHHRWDRPRRLSFLIAWFMDTALI